MKREGVIRMAEIQVEGLNLGYTEKPYDFTDDATGRQVTGVSQLLHILLEDATDVLVVKVPDAMVATAKALPVKARVSLVVNVPKGVRPTLVDAA